jgi:single-strand DNA-binding protein
MSLPTLTGVGRLTADPELRFTSSGTAVCKVSIAFNARRKNDRGEWEDGDSYFAYGTAFNKLAENLAESLSKGTEVNVTGRLKTRQYEKDGEKRSVVELLIDAIGPNLAYATAKVEKASRDGGGNGGRRAEPDPSF